MRNIVKSSMVANVRVNKEPAVGTYLRVLEGTTLWFSFDDSEQFFPLQAGQSIKIETGFKYVTYYSEQDQGQVRIIILNRGEIDDNTLQVLDSNISVTLGGLAQVVSGPTPLNVQAKSQTVRQVVNNGSLNSSAGRVQWAPANPNRKRLHIYSYANGQGDTHVYLSSSASWILHRIGTINYNTDRKFEVDTTGPIFLQHYGLVTTGFYCSEDVYI